MGWTISGIMVFLWLLSFISNAGALWIHLLLALATIVFVVSFVIQHDPESSWA